MTGKGKPRRRSPRLCLVSLGCPKNQVDSEKMLADFAGRGFTLVPAPEQADVVVVNTCAFIQDAEAEAVQALAEAEALKRAGRIRGIVAAGCLVAKHGKEKLQRLMPMLDELLLPQEASLAAETAAGRWLAEKPAAGLQDRVLLSGPGTAYLKIAEGCSRRCSFCLIPGLRGPLVSAPVPGLLREAQRLARQGVRELVLVAQDTLSFGRDVGDPRALDRLLAGLVKIAGLRWIRVMYANPDAVTDALLERIASEKKICKYIDMPVQHASRKILRAMRRTGDADALLQKVERIRSLIPGAALRTTLLTGFPGENERDHRELLAFLQAAQFDRAGVFSFSRQAGTPAADLPGQVPAATRRRRRRELMDLQAGISRQRLARRRGQVLECLIEEPSGRGQWIGRTCLDAPEVDGAVVLTGPGRPGEIVKTRITGSTDHDLTGDIL